MILIILIPTDSVPVKAELDYPYRGQDDLPQVVEANRKLYYLIPGTNAHYHEVPKVKVL